eukprot:188165-Chlamydomonas_euryale.AAC.2
MCVKEGGSSPHSIQLAMHTPGSVHAHMKESASACACRAACEHALCTMQVCVGGSVQALSVRHTRVLGMPCMRMLYNMRAGWGQHCGGPRHMDAHGNVGELDTVPAAGP